MDAQGKAAAASAAPIIDLNIGKEVLDLLHPTTVTVTNPAAAPVPHSPFIQPAPQYDL